MDVKFLSESSDDSNARATDLGIILEIKGKILAAANGDAEDDTRKVAQWSLVPAESSDAYRTVSLEVISAGQMVRKIDMTNAFVVDYEDIKLESVRKSVKRKLRKLQLKVDMLLRKHNVTQGGRQSRLSPFIFIGGNYKNNVYK